MIDYIILAAIAILVGVGTITRLKNKKGKKGCSGMGCSSCHSCSFKENKK